MADQGAEGLFSPFLRMQRLKAVQPYIKGSVLDVGCGTGVIANIVPPDRYLGVDICERSLAIARQKYPQHHFKSVLPPGKPIFDTVIAMAVIEHVKDPEAFLRELALRLMNNSNSFIVCTTPHPSVTWIHRLGSIFGLFSRHANEEHETLIDYSQIKVLSNECNLNLAVYRSFLFGANQLAIFHKIISFL